MSLGLPGGLLSARNCECCVDGSMLYCDPHSHVVERGGHSYQALLRLGVGMCLGFKLRNPCRRSILSQGNALRLLSRLSEGAMGILRGGVNHSPIPRPRGSLWVCQTAKALQKVQLPFIE